MFMQVFTPQDISRLMSGFDEDATGCWIWRGSKDRGGYGTINARCFGVSRTVSTHRMSYQVWIGPVLRPYQLDHLCRVPACGNPDHLEIVTQSENVRRGYASGSRKRTHCKNGHEFTPENTYIHREKNGNWRRQCKTCIFARVRERRARMREC